MGIKGWEKGGRGMSSQILITGAAPETYADVDNQEKERK